MARVGGNLGRTPPKPEDRCGVISGNRRGPLFSQTWGRKAMGARRAGRNSNEQTYLERNGPLVGRRALGGGQHQWAPPLSGERVPTWSGSVEFTQLTRG